MDVPAGPQPGVLGRTTSRRQVLRGAGVVAVTAPLLARSRPAAAVDFGTVLWQPITIGTPIAGIAFRLGTGDDNLNGPTDLSAASAVIASVVVRTASGQATVTRQLNDPWEGWPDRSLREKWFPLTTAALPTVLAENISSVALHFESALSDPFADNWNLSALTLLMPRTGALAEPPFVGSLNPDDFTILATGSGSPWLHRFKGHVDSEGGPDLTSVNPFWIPADPQRRWRWCNRCQGLFFGGNPTTGTCPLGGGHNSGGSGNYVLVAYAGVAPAGVQAGWRWCNRCQGLWAAVNGTAGVCPAGGGHSSTGSGAYTPFFGDGVTGSKQGGWRWCNRCQGMFFAGNPTPGVCPAGGGHTGASSAHYMISFAGREP